MENARTTHRGRLADRAGFSLPAAILGIILLAALAMFGTALMRGELQSQVRITSRSTAFYAAETGLGRALENWTRPPVVEPGGSWLVDAGDLPGGSSFEVRATRLDGTGAVQPLYAIEAEGRAKGGTIERAGLLATTVPFGSPATGALKAKGKVRVVGQSEVDGWDSVPAPWSPDCPPPSGGRTGVAMTDTSKVTRQGSATIEGDPPVDGVSDTTGFFSFGDLSYWEVAGMADHTIPGPVNISSGPAPSYNADGTCNTGDTRNWGDPEYPGQPCGDFYPIIHVEGDLTASGSGAGQGILLVDGTLSVCGGFTFYGVVVALGEVKSCGSGFKLVGGVVSGQTDLNPSGGLVAGSNRLQYSACAVERVLSRSGASRPEMLTQRSWYSTR